MTLSLRLSLLVVSILVLSLIIYCIVKRKLNIKYSIVWFLWAILAVLMALFPEVFYDLTGLIGIETPSNAVFLIMIALLYMLVFYVFIMISKHNEEIIKLTYEISVLKKELEKIKNEK